MTASEPRARRQPLDGIRVIDLTRILSGPFCTMLLADMGADVVKVEPPGKGDPVREQGVQVNGLSWYFASFNRNKRSLALDLRSDQGKAVLARLLANADVLVENFRPGVLAEMGLDQARLEAINPRLVVASVNGYGSTGPYVDRPSFDFIAQAMTGLMSTSGDPDGPPMRTALPITDLVAGLYCAFGIVNALRARDLDGRGQRVEAAMVNGTVSMLAYLASEFLATGKLPERTGNDHPIAAPYGLYRAKDGDIAIAPSTNESLRKLLRELGLEEMLDRPEYATPQLRHARRHDFRGPIEAALATDTQENWIRRLNAAGVPCGKVLALDEVFADPQIRAQEMVLEVDHPGHGVVRMVGFPVKLSGTPCTIRHPSPALGGQSRAILLEAGFAAEEIQRLESDGVLGQGPVA